MRAAEEPGMSNRERSYEAAAAYWHTYRKRLAEIVSVSQLAMVNDDFAKYWADLPASDLLDGRDDRTGSSRWLQR